MNTLAMIGLVAFAYIVGLLYGIRTTARRYQRLLRERDYWRWR